MESVKRGGEHVTSLKLSRRGIKDGKRPSKQGRVAKTIKENLHTNSGSRPADPEMEDEMASLESDEDAELNRIGSVPLSWYDDYGHVGYNVEGEKVARTIDLSEITRLLNDADDPESWKTTYDIKNQTTFKLTPSDIEVIRRVKAGSFPLASFDAYGPDSTVDYDNPDAAIHPSFSSHPPKRRFLPSLAENRRINQLVKLIRDGKIRPEPLEEPEAYDLWGSSILTEINDTARGRVKGPPPLPAPKLALPGHAESYNPPEEFLMTEGEQQQWINDHPEDKEMPFLPQKFTSLRRVPLYSDGIRERFERCLDLYLCPRAMKMRMNVDPDSLLPHLPGPKDLKPFPSSLSLCFNSNEASPAKQLSFDATGSYLGVGRANGVVEIFDIVTSRRLVRLKFSDDDIPALAFNPVLPIVAFSQGAATFVIVLHLPAFLGRESHSAKQSNISPVNAPSCWDVLAALKAAQLEGEENPSESAVDIWQRLEAPQIDDVAIGGWKLEHRSAVNHISWHHRGLYFTTVSSSASSPSLQLGIHSLSKLKSIRPFRKSGGGKVQRAAFHPTNNWLFVAFYNSLRLYNLQKTTDAAGSRIGELVKKFAGIDGVSDLALHPSGTHVVLGGLNRRVTWFDLDLGQRPYKILRYHKSSVTTVGFHKSYPLMFSGAADGSIHIFHSKVLTDLMSSPAIIPVKKLNASMDLASTCTPVLHCLWHPTHPWLAAALKSGDVGLFA